MTFENFSSPSPERNVAALTNVMEFPHWSSCDKSYNHGVSPSFISFGFHAAYYKTPNLAAPASPRSATLILSNHSNHIQNNTYSYHHNKRRKSC